MLAMFSLLAIGIQEPVSPMEWVIVHENASISVAAQAGTEWPTTRSEQPVALIVTQRATDGTVSQTWQEVAMSCRPDAGSVSFLNLQWPRQVNLDSAAPKRSTQTGYPPFVLAPFSAENPVHVAARAICSPMADTKPKLTGAWSEVVGALRRHPDSIDDR